MWHHRVEMTASQHVVEARKVLAKCGKLKSLRAANFRSKRSLRNSVLYGSLFQSPMGRGKSSDVYIVKIDRPRGRIIQVTITPTSAGFEEFVAWPIILHSSNFVRLYYLAHGWR